MTTMFRILKGSSFISTLQILKITSKYGMIARPPVKNITSISYSRKFYNTQACGSQRFYSQQPLVEEIVVDYEHVKKATSSGKSLIIDVREPDEIKEYGKIPNSVNIPLGNVSTALGAMSDKDFEKLYNKPKPVEDTEIIFYCMIGKRSGMAQQNAINLGYKNAKNYVGSWTDWTSKTQK